jgi:hypothetical protein
MLKKALQNIIKENNKKPVAVQCLWDSDVNYLALDIDLVYKTKQGYEKRRVMTFNYMDFESQDVLSETAKKIGKTLAEKHNAEFYFPSPDEWSRDCPDWWKAKSAFKCEDCGTPIIQTDSKYLPKEVCYPCHLTREQNEELKNNLSTENRYSIYKNNDEEIPRLNYSKDFNNLIICQYLNRKEIERNFHDSSGEYTITSDQLITLTKKMKHDIDKKLLEYKKPLVHKQMSKLNTKTSIDYNGITYQFFTIQDRTLIHLISKYNDYEQAKIKGIDYTLFVIKGINKRDDSILRYINYQCHGNVEKEQIIKNYFKILSEKQIDNAINKLLKNKCLNLIENKLYITKQGKSII